VFRLASGSRVILLPHGDARLPSPDPFPAMGSRKRCGAWTRRKIWNASPPVWPPKCPSRAMKMAPSMRLPRWPTHRPARLGQAGVQIRGQSRQHAHILSPFQPAPHLASQGDPQGDQPCRVLFAGLCGIV
jgi:hypothetical protein